MPELFPDYRKQKHFLRVSKIQECYFIAILNILYLFVVSTIIIHCIIFFSVIKVALHDTFQIFSGATLKYMVFLNCFQILL